MEIKALRGVSDILPNKVREWQFIEQVARKTFELYGYQEIRTPIIEEAVLFKRTIGETTDIVEKQMYTFSSAGGRKISLRPEATASAVRAYLEHAFDKRKEFAKFYYIGPMFRSERPQKGRMRQFHQLGIEAIGSLSPYLDAEVISLALNLLKKIDISGAVCKINSLGCRKDKKKIAEALRGNLEKKFDSLCKDCQRRFSRNVFRVLDCKVDNCRKIIHKLPPLTKYLCSACDSHFREVKKALAALDIKCILDPYLVRGLDYYTKTAFEISHPALGSQDAIGAGGRYDNLVSDMGGPPLGAIGFALGIERLIIAVSDLASKEAKGSSIDVYIATIGEAAYREGFKLASLLREKDISVEVDYLERSLKSQMRAANKRGAKFVVVFGDEELERKKVALKDMSTGTQQELALGANFAEKLKKIVLRNNFLDPEESKATKDLTYEAQS